MNEAILNSLRGNDVTVYFNDNTRTLTGVLIRETDERYCVHDRETAEELRFVIDEVVTINSLEDEDCIFVDTVKE